MHFLGIAGMPRRIPDYPDIYFSWNFIASIGAYFSFFGLLLFLFILLQMMLGNFKIYNYRFGYLVHIVNNSKIVVTKSFSYKNQYNINNNDLFFKRYINNTNVVYSFLSLLNKKLDIGFILKLFKNKQ